MLSDMSTIPGKPTTLPPSVASALNRLVDSLATDVLANSTVHRLVSWALLVIAPLERSQIGNTLAIVLASAGAAGHVVAVHQSSKSTPQA